MKKIIAMLLMMLMSVSLIACGGKEKQGLEPAAGQEAIEITTENWQTYFEIKEDVDVYKTEKDGAEVVKAYMDKYICLKEEYKGKFVASDITFTYKPGKQEVKKLTYNIADGSYTLSDSAAVFPEDKEVADDKLPTIVVTEAETQMYINAYADAEGSDSATYVCDTMLRPELEFTKVEGKMIVTK